MTLKIKTFQAKHVHDLKLASFQAETLGVADDSYGQLLESHCRIAQSLFLGRRVIACWGLVPLWHGVSEAWMLVSDDVGLGAKTMVRSIQGILNCAIEHRIQTSVLASHTKGLRFMDYLGFEPEGIMRRYDTLGRDHIRYARTSNG